MDRPGSRPEPEALLGLRPFLRLHLVDRQATPGVDPADASKGTYAVAVEHRHGSEELAALSALNARSSELGRRHADALAFASSMILATSEAATKLRLPSLTTRIRPAATSA
jgi:hypothetical protein